MTFEKDLQSVINCHSKENGSNTPDYILADYLAGALRAFDQAVSRRRIHHLNSPVTIEDIKQALARGYCHPKTQHLELDSEVIEAMSAEIGKLLGMEPVAFIPREPWSYSPPIEEICPSCGAKTVGRCAKQACRE